MLYRWTMLLRWRVLIVVVAAVAAATALAGQASAANHTHRHRAHHNHRGVRHARSNDTRQHRIGHRAGAAERPAP